MIGCGYPSFFMYYKHRYLIYFMFPIPKCSTHTHTHTHTHTYIYIYIYKTTMFSQTQQSYNMLFIDLGNFGRHVSIHLESSSGPLQKYRSIT